MWRHRLTVSLLVALLVSAADCSPTGPSVTTTTTSAPVLTRLQISGDPSLGPGVSTQLAATATYSDGKVEDVTQRAEWASSNPTIATVSATGLVTAVSLGEATIAARYGYINVTLRDGLSVLVQPPGTYKLSGRITEAGGVPLVGARVDVMTGATAGQLAVMDGNAYRIYGLTGYLTIRAVRDGYADQTKTVSMTENRVVDFDLQQVLAPAVVAGDYMLTIRVSESAGCTLSDELKTRSYTAHLSQAGARVDVTLGGATFLPSKNIFSGIVRGNTVQFDLKCLPPGCEEFYGGRAWDWEVVETVPSGNLTIGGTANTTINGASILGTLDGWFQLFGKTGTIPTVCWAKDHAFTFIK